MSRPRSPDPNCCSPWHGLDGSTASVLPGRPELAGPRMWPVGGGWAGSAEGGGTRLIGGDETVVTTAAERSLVRASAPAPWNPVAAGTPPVLFPGTEHGHWAPGP